MGLLLEKKRCGLFALYATDVEGVSSLKNSWDQKIKTKLQKIKECIPGITTSFSYIGSFPSTFGLHVEDLNFWSVNVHCGGANKIWYTIPQNQYQKMVDYLKSN